MSQKGYFSGKTEYERKSGGKSGNTGNYGKQGNSGKGGGYGRTNDGERTGNYGKPGGYNKQGGYRGEGGGYGRTNDGERTGNYAKPGGYNKQGGYRGEGQQRPYERPRYDDRRKPIEEEKTEIAPEQTQSDELPFLIIGRNAVREAVKANRSIDRILISAEPDGSLREIAGLARDRKILVRETARKALDELCMPFGHGNKPANHQGIVAYAAGVEYCNVSDILQNAKSRGEAPFVIVLDGIMDPHNLGSIIRSANCAGAHGVVIGKRRSASVTAATVKAAAGATEHVPIARVTNITAAIEELKKANVFIAGADMKGEPMNKQNLSGALALVIGGEGEGLTKLVRESCDFTVSVPMFGELDSLNASVAAGVLMFEKRRQDAAGVAKA